MRRTGKVTLSDECETMNLKEQMDEIYRELPPERIPWNLDGPPTLIEELVESQRLLPCEAVDLGCGSGNCAVWLAEQGFQVMGLDISPKAIELARQHTQTKAVACRFMAVDLTSDLAAYESSFDFALPQPRA